MVNRADWLLGSTGQHRGKQETRLDLFVQKLESPYNFLFDAIDDSTFLRATFSSIDVLLQLPSDTFGSPMDWRSYKGLGKADDGQCDLDLDILTNDIPADDEDEDEEHDHSVTIAEIGPVPSLIEYQAMDIDRRPGILQQWITDLRDGNSLGDGWYEAEIENKMRHDIPGRLLPTSPASLAQLTREARTVPVAGRCIDLDFPASHLFSLSAILKENDCLDGFPMIRRFAQYCSNWREVWGNQALTSIIYGGVPDGDAWNPVTWTLAVELKSAALKILACDQYQYLVAMFQNSRHPLYTRLYYALSAHDAHRRSYLDSNRPYTTNLSFPLNEMKIDLSKF